MGLSNFRTEYLIWDRVNSHITYSLETNSGDSNGRKLRVQVLDGGVVTTLSGVSLSLAWKTANQRNSGLDAFKVVDATLGIFEIYYTTEMLSNVGKLKASLVLVDATGRMESDTFLITVNPTMVDDNAVQSENSFTALTEALINVSDVKTQLSKTVKLDDKGVLNLNVFDEPSRNILQGQSEGTINAVLGDGNVKNNNIANKSVTGEKTDFFNVSNNLFNPRDPNYLTGKGFSGFTDTIIVDNRYIITGFMFINPLHKLFISNNGIEVTTASWFKIASYDSKGMLIKVEYYTIGGYVLPATSSIVRISVADVGKTLQIEHREVTSYTPYYKKLASDVIPLIESENIVEKSITPDKTTFFNTGKNRFNPSDPNYLIGKGFSSFTNTIVDAGIYNISGFVTYNGSEKIVISDNGQEVTKASSFKIASYDINNNWISTAYYALGGYTPPVLTSSYRVQFLASSTAFQIEEGAAATSYEMYRGIFIDEDYLPDLKKSSIDGLGLTSYGDSITFRNSWQPYVANYFKLKHTNLGIGSTTLAYVEQHEAAYPSFTNKTRMDAVIASNPDILTMLGGTNDKHRGVPIGNSAEFAKAIADKDKSNFKGAYSFIIETFLTWKPELEIILMTPTKAKGWSDYTEYVEATKEVARYYALPCIDLQNESGISTFNADKYTLDGLHPNADGGKRIANLVIDKLNSLSYS